MGLLSRGGIFGGGWRSRKNSLAGWKTKKDNVQENNSPSKKLLSNVVSR